MGEDSALVDTELPEFLGGQVTNVDTSCKILLSS